MAYRTNDQFRLQELKLYREGWPEDKKIDIMDSLLEFEIYEDFFSGTLTASMFVVDIYNINDVLPVMGGERIDIRYKTPTRNDTQTLTFVIGSIASRNRTEDNSDYQGYSWNLVTVDRWVDSELEISGNFQGTYDEIIKQILGRLKTTRKMDFEKTMFPQNYIAPYWSPIRCCSAISARAFGSKFEPFNFWETIDGYSMKSLLTVYKQKPYARFTMGNGGIESATPDQIFRRVHSYEYLPSTNRMRQESRDAFGTKIFTLDSVSKRFNLKSLDYMTMSKSDDFAKIDKFQTYDHGYGKRDKTSFQLARLDKSNEASAYRNMLKGLIDSYRLKLMIPGDPDLRTGMIIELDVKDNSINKTNKAEKITSGRWLITAIKHTIKRRSYYMSIEICKDSHSVDVVKLVKGYPNDDKAKQPTGVKSPS